MLISYPANVSAQDQTQKRASRCQLSCQKAMLLSLVYIPAKVGGHWVCKDPWCIYVLQCGTFRFLRRRSETGGSSIVKEITVVVPGEDEKEGEEKWVMGKDWTSEILTWVLERWEQQLPVTISAYALKRVKEKFPDCQFNASCGWGTKFLRCHSLFLRMKTSVVQTLPTDLELQISNFHQMLHSIHSNNDIKLDLIGNMDETPAYFDIVPGRTIDIKGQKSVLIHTTGCEKRHFTVTLTITASVEMLQLFVIFKGKRKLKPTHPSGVVVAVQEKGWMDEPLML